MFPRRTFTKFFSCKKTEEKGLRVITRQLLLVSNTTKTKQQLIAVRLGLPQVSRKNNNFIEY
eukprot:snap_masked-scaffold_16-processed-gene-2.10-mRNA-1 protein AED:1.00 eAED:1.00 QI:0/0/0/0/1/1/2/0/61